MFAGEPPTSYLMFIGGEAQLSNSLSDALLICVAANDTDIVEFNMVHGQGLGAGTGTGDALCHHRHNQQQQQPPQSHQEQQQQQQLVQDTAVVLPHTGNIPPVRYCFLHAAWAKGLGLAGGRYWIVPPSRSVRGTLSIQTINTRYQYKPSIHPINTRYQFIV